jgi:hypothetical protein
VIARPFRRCRPPAIVLDRNGVGLMIGSASRRSTLSVSVATFTLSSSSHSCPLHSGVRVVGDKRLLLRRRWRIVEPEPSLVLRIVKL